MQISYGSGKLFGFSYARICVKKPAKIFKNVRKAGKWEKAKSCDFKYFLKFEEISKLKGFDYESVGRPFELGRARQ